jgi:hypothetical protein
MDTLSDDFAELHDHREQLGAMKREKGNDAREQALRDEDQTTAYLLLQLRKANRRVQRLRAVALAAMEGGPEQIRVALAALKPHDLDR